MMNNSVYPVKAADEPHTSSVATLPPPRKRVRQCRFCECWMEQHNLPEHLRTSHGEEGSIEAERIALPKRRKIQHDVEQTDTVQNVNECKVDQDSTSSSVNLDMPVRNYLERKQSCPFCKRFIDEKVLTDHMRHCCFREVGEERGSSSNKDASNLEVRKRAAPQKEECSRKCLLCDLYIDYKYLVDHLRNFHPKEVKEAFEKVNPIEGNDALRKVDVVSLTPYAPEKKPDLAPKPGFGDAPISAASLLEESSMSAHCNDEDDGEGGTVSEDQSGDSPMETANHAETELSCSLCVKLNQRMAQLESTVERLTERLMGLEELMLFKKAVKEEVV